MRREGKGAPGAKKGTMKRLIRTLFEFYPKALPLIILGIIFSAVVSSIPSVFMQNIIAIVEQSWQSGNWNGVSEAVFKFVGILLVLYILSLVSAFAYTQAMAVLTQGFLKKLRVKMFNGMQNLPIKYFDTHNHGDIMSYYTNDIDTLRQLISQSLPNLLISSVTIITVFSIMIYFSVWLTLVVFIGVAAIILVTKKVGGNSAKYFILQQMSIAKAEGFIEEMMNGQKVVQVFCHEDESKDAFDKINDELFENSKNANKFANMLMPILGNIGNTMYVLVAIAGGLLLLSGAPNVSISGMAMGISIVVPFLNMTKQFCGNINQVSNQINAVVMALAGADRIFELIDQKPEEDEGYVTLVNVKEENGELVECKERTGMWAWKHPHKAEGTVTYERLMGDVRMENVDFGYEPDKTVLHDITLYAKPGQKVAFVGATAPERRRLRT